VLAEPGVRQADAIVILGDVAAGPLPVQVLDSLLALGDRAVWVRGNAEREILDAARGADSPYPVSNWAAAQLSPRHLDAPSDLPTTVRLSITGLGEVLFCHATPRDDTEIVLVNSSPRRWQRALADVDHSITTVVCGHTHMPFTRIVDGVMVVNPGSIGMPYGRPGAAWALLGPGIALQHTAFDYDAACARITTESGYPDAAQWADEYVRARNTDLDALTAFTPTED
ncbi:MAG: metallophosphoesterase family protein, partial [Stackebrandtia sp.]